MGSEPWLGSLTPPLRRGQQAGRWLSPRSGAAGPLPAPRRARFAAHYRATAALAVPGSRPSFPWQIDAAPALPRDAMQARVGRGRAGSCGALGGCGAGLVAQLASAHAAKSAHSRH